MCLILRAWREHAARSRAAPPRLPMAPARSGTAGSSAAHGAQDSPSAQPDGHERCTMQLRSSGSTPPPVVRMRNQLRKMPQQCAQPRRHTRAATRAHAEMGGAAMHRGMHADGDTRQRAGADSQQPHSRRAHRPHEGPGSIDVIPHNQNSPRNRPNEKSSRLLTKVKLLLTYMRLNRRDGCDRETSQTEAPLTQETDAEAARRPRRHVATLTCAKVGPRYNEMLRSLLNRRRGVG